jgi:Icc protein
MRILQISDCHVGRPGELMADRVDAAAMLRRTVRRIHDLVPAADLVLATGDLVNDGLPAQYDELMDVLGGLDIPVLPCPGNHDDRTELRRRFPDLPTGRADEPIDHVVEWGELVLIGLDTTVVGEHVGRLEPAQLTWLDRRLAAAGDRPVVVFQHHPPFRCGVPWMDRFALAQIDEERAVIERHRNVVAVLAGHYHLPLHHRIGTASGWSMASTAALIDAQAAVAGYTDEPPVFGVHSIDDAGAVTTRVVPVSEFERWRPSWAHDG